MDRGRPNRPLLGSRSPPEHKVLPRARPWPPPRAPPMGAAPTLHVGPRPRAGECRRPLRSPHRPIAARPRSERRGPATSTSAPPLPPTGRWAAADARERPRATRSSSDAPPSAATVQPPITPPRVAAARRRRAGSRARARGAAVDPVVSTPRAASATTTTAVATTRRPPPTPRRALARGPAAGTSATCWCAGCRPRPSPAAAGIISPPITHISGCPSSSSTMAEQARGRREAAAARSAATARL